MSHRQGSDPRAPVLRDKVASQTVPTTCQNCGKRPATENFTTDTTAFAHGWVQRWCGVCVLEVQIKHAKERARKLPAMERKLVRLKAREARKPKGRRA